MAQFFKSMDILLEWPLNALFGGLLALALICVSLNIWFHFKDSRKRRQRNREYERRCQPFRPVDPSDFSDTERFIHGYQHDDDDDGTWPPEFDRALEEAMIGDSTPPTEERIQQARIDFRRHHAPKVARRRSLPGNDWPPQAS